ncbi:MAG: right-handed parallel beta-helix repeat-containing protein [Candidatus Electryonea clarkiae]|nr:right-handed parallel beta-helix repeat-containing protein [Candidatus Electryonea clarkiae]MDP8285285.1 right-handed parallel beta-helix repeat-containing protein [Candidatus Electryonea clarkiae]
MSSVHPLQNRSVLLFFIPILLTVLSLSLSVTTLHAQTEVEGDVYGVWDEEGSPYLVMDTLTIPEDSTLTIEPGVTVEFQDQDDDRFPFYVIGTLEAVGEEGDSIIFQSPDAPFHGFILPDDFEDARLHLEYVVVDSVYISIYSFDGNCTLRHSRIVATWRNQTNIAGTDTVSNCVFRDTAPGTGVILLGGRGPNLFQYNDARQVNINCWSTPIAPVHHNRFQNLDLSNNNVEVHHNQGVTGDGDHGTYNFHHNTFIGIGSDGSTVTIENNNIEILNISDCDATIQYNEIIEVSDLRTFATILLGNSDFILRKNLVTSLQSWAIRISESSGIIDGNTIDFFESDIGIYIRDIDDAIIQNNIFIGDGVNCTAIDAGFDPGFFENIHYNIFHNVSEIINRGDGDEVDSTNTEIDPRLSGGEPYDYHLQPNSPSIDAGDLDSPDDPDDTRADIGAFFYDQSIDNPPALISPFRLIEQSGTEFSYTALSIDDEGPLTFHFENLPDWLEEDENNLVWVADSAVVSGIIPEDIQEFEFRVLVEDGLGQNDTADVYCELINFSLLRGVTTGVLSSEDSPYMVVEDVIVPEGDSLLFEPGVTCYFKSVDHFDHRLKFKAYGTMIALGIDDDSVRFIPEVGFEPEPGSRENRQWHGIWLLGPNADTSRFSHVILESSAWSIIADSSSLVVIDSSLFKNNRHAIFVKNNSQALIRRNIFYADSGNSGGFIDVISSSAEIRNCSFEIYPDDYYFYHISDSWTASNIIIDSCTFMSGSGVHITDTSYVEITHNIFDSHNYMIGLTINNSFTGMNSASGIVANNLFNRIGRIMMGTAQNLYFTNNIIRESIIGIEFVNTPTNLHLYNNIFTGNQLAIKSRDFVPEYDETQYNCFFENDTNSYRCALDSTNIFGDPIFVDTLEYRLYVESPGVNAGHPDSVYYDSDNSGNDIGIWGGSWGESYDYESLFVDENISIPLAFSLDAPYPNPFNPILVIPFQVPSKSDIKISIYNILGQIVKVFDFREVDPGSYRQIWDASGLPSGIFFIELRAGEIKFQKKVVLVK